MSDNHDGYISTRERRYATSNAPREHRWNWLYRWLRVTWERYLDR